MNRCLICFGAVEESFNNNVVCNKCLSKFKEINRKIYIDGIEVLILYEYDNFFRELLYRYKGCYDYYLKDAFFGNNLVRLKKKYKNRKVICAPSFHQEDIRRGYNHVIEIAKCLGLDIIDCLKKTSDYKQSSKNYKNRSEIQKYIKIDKNAIKEKDRLLIVDDVTTSLSTIKAIIHLLPTNNDKKILILASGCRFVRDEIN